MAKDIHKLEKPQPAEYGLCASCEKELAQLYKGPSRLSQQSLKGPKTMASQTLLSLIGKSNITTSPCSECL